MVSPKTHEVSGKRNGEDDSIVNDEEMRNGEPFSLLNDEHMSNKVGVEHQPDNFVYIFHGLIFSMGFFKRC